MSATSRRGSSVRILAMGGLSLVLIVNGANFNAWSRQGRGIGVRRAIAALFARWAAFTGKRRYLGALRYNQGRWT